MAVIYSQPVKVDRHQATLARIDAQAAPARLVIYDATNAALCTFTLNKPSGTVTTNGGAVVIAFTTPLNATVIQAGVAHHAAIQDGSGTDAVTGLTVGIDSSYNIVLTSLTFTVNEPVQLTSARIQHA